MSRLLLVGLPVLPLATGRGVRLASVGAAATEARKAASPRQVAETRRTQEHDVIVARLNRHRLFPRQSRAIGARQFGALGVFVDIGGKDRVRRDAKLRQKFLSARAA